jgi:tripartite-type tricarboxylate transporter receptor subunit TctC
MVIPFAAGGPTDVLGRVMAQRMGEVLGQQVVVENVGGAGGMTGSKRVADAAPDGYTFVLGTVGTHAQGQSLYKKPLYNAIDDFTPVALARWNPACLVTMTAVALLLLRMPCGIMTIMWLPRISTPIMRRSGGLTTCGNLLQPGHG